MVGLSWATTTIKRHGGWFLIFSFLLLLPTKTLFNVPIALMAVCGLVLSVRNFARIRADRMTRWVLALFLCMWVPMLLSLPDAVNFPHAGVSTMKYLRFAFMGIFVVHALREPHARRCLAVAIFSLLLFWCADALIQFALGKNLFGYPDRGNRLAGIFYPRFRLGIVLASLAPLYFDMARRVTDRAWLTWLLCLPLIVVVVLTGSRSAWLMLLVAVPGYLIYLYLHEGVRKLTPGMWLMVAMMGGVTTAAAWNYPGLTARVQAAAGVFSADVEAIDIATARRLSIWGPALEMLQANWLNGIGVRGFRYEFMKVAGPDNFWMSQTPPGVTHPHQLFIEIAVESGVLGVIGYVGFAALCVSFLRRREQAAWELSLPLALCVLVALFPLNVHKALYASFWSSISWWLVCIFIAGLATAQSAPDNRA